MSCLASITVHGCDGDGCTALAVLQTEAEWEAFEATWFDGLSRHFCPACKTKVVNAASIAAEENFIAALKEAASCRAFNEETTERDRRRSREYVN